MATLDSYLILRLCLEFNFLGDVTMEGKALEEEILSVLNIPPGKMGRIIGKNGASILTIKKSCK